MKKMLFIMLLFCTINVYASTVTITGSDVRMRKSASTSSSILYELDKGVETTFIGTGSSGNGCSEIWYQVEYKGTTGYVCSTYAKLETGELSEGDYETYEEYLKALGFPDDYIPKISKLHTNHPNWKFEVLNTKLDFNTILKKEYDGYSKGWSLIEDTNHSIDGYKSVDSWSYNYLTDKFSTNFEGGGKSWFAASKQTISYYMDPRNFLSDKYVFMFKTLSFDATTDTASGVKNALKNTFMESGYADSENKKTFVDAFMDAASKYNVSPYVLVARVLQEVGTNGSTIVNGKVSGYEGYYNFYNINAYGNTNTETINNGLAYAKKKGWDTKYKAIVGGASFLSSSYINAGQNTQYLQKWDLIGTTVTNQYMQNIQAPYSEAAKMYSAYNTTGILNAELKFTIPIYNNMPTSTSLPNKGNPNNYLSSLSVDGSYLFSSATKETDFEITIAAKTESIEVLASKVNSKATISGTGVIPITDDNQKHVLTVTAQNGDKREYTINITRNKPETSINIAEIIINGGLNNDGVNISGLTVGQDVSEIITKLKTEETLAEITITNIDGEEKTEGRISTGDKLKIKTEREEKEYTLIIYGDANSDGQIDKLDALAILRDYYKYSSLDGSCKNGADVNKDGVIDKLDALAVLRDYYNYAKIEQ